MTGRSAVVALTGSPRRDHAPRRQARQRDGQHTGALASARPRTGQAARAGDDGTKHGDRDPRTPPQSRHHRPHVAEQVEGKDVDARSDVFSLGVLLYQMSTGKRPFLGRTPVSMISSIIKDDPIPVTEIDSSLPPHLGRIIRHCLQKDKSRRYSTARELHNELVLLQEEGIENSWRRELLRMSPPIAMICPLRALTMLSDSRISLKASGSSSVSPETVSAFV